MDEKHSEVNNLNYNTNILHSVVKFGGSHFKNPNGYVTASEYIVNNPLAIPVVSAIYGMTNQLADLYDSRYEQLKFDKQLEQIWKTYKPYLTGNEEYEIEQELEYFRKNRKNLSLARVKGSGEHHSAHILQNYLEDRDIRSQALTGYETGIYLNHHGTLDLEASRKNIQDAVAESLDRDCIPIIGGYQGRAKENPNEYALGGRGSSDLFATAVAVSLSVPVEIIKDVPGVCPLDPNIWPCKPLEKLSYDEMSKLSWRGNPVICPGASSMARDNHVPIIVKNTESEGTLISRESQTTEEQPYAGITTNKAPMITIEDPIMDTEEGDYYLAHAIESVKGIRSISGDPGEISFTLMNNHKESVDNIKNNMQKRLEKKAYSPKIIQESVYMISICGDGMRERVGTLAEVAETIKDTNTSIRMATQTDEKPSSPSITICVDMEKGQEVTKALAEKYFKAYKLNNFNKE